jgi:serine/threonine-protein phosphatase 5
MSPGNKEAQNKYQECQKIVRRIAFEKAISSDHMQTSVADSIRLEDFGIISISTLLNNKNHK